MKDKKTESLRIRVTTAERDDLKKLAALLEEDESATARRAVNALIRYAKARDWQITLPLVLAEPAHTEPGRLKAA